MGFRISTGITALDFFLSGGFTLPSLVHLYGEPGTGKTTLGYHLLKNFHERGLKTVWLDFNESFSLRRLLSLSKDHSILKSFRIFQLKSNLEFKKSLNILKIEDNEKLLVLDNFTYYYQLSQSEEKLGAFYNMLHHQLMRVMAAVKRNSMLCLLINQVRTTRDGNFYPVGGSLLNELAGYVLTTLYSNDVCLVKIIKGSSIEPNQFEYGLFDAGWSC